MSDPEHDALANMAAASERRIDQLHDDGEALEVRVARLESELTALREHLREEVKRAAVELRDDSDFAGPYWKSGADHVAEHYISKAGRALIKWIAAIAVGIVIFEAGRRGLIK